MNELVILVGTLATIGWLYFWVLFAVGVGFLLFDRRPKAIASEQAEPLQQRHAA